MQMLGINIIQVFKEDEQIACPLCRDTKIEMLAKQHAPQAVLYSVRCTKCGVCGPYAPTPDKAKLKYRILSTTL